MSFESFLKANLPRTQSFHPSFNQALTYSLEAGGKHFRAKLLLGVVRAKASSLLEKAYKAALALEFIHTYSLIHDDLPAMDDAALRRGQPSLHKFYDEATAILVGDALNTQAFLLLSEAEFEPTLCLELIKTLSFNAGLNGMVLGQALDCFFEDKKLDLAQLEFLHTHKTAKLIAASLKMGALIASLSSKECEKLYELGLKLGLIFQINDDIIDATQSEAQSGKSVKNDKHKNSFVNLLGLRGAKEAKARLLGEFKKESASLEMSLSSFLNELIQSYL